MIIIVFSGCVALNPNMELVLSHERVVGMGLSAAPPEGFDWYRLYSPDGGLHYAKKIDDPTHTLVCEVRMIPMESPLNFKSPQEFLTFVENSKKADADNQRFKDADYKINLSQEYGPNSVTFEFKATDSKYKSNSGKDLILKAMGRTFVHPIYSNHLVDIVCSERSEHPDFSDISRNISHKFIQNVRIESK